jgi:outer membrane receptor protein involved in Fe transport
VVPPGFVTTTTYTVPRNLNTVWTGLRYALWPNLDLAAGVYWESQSDFLAAPGICTGSGSATSNNRCSGGRYSYSFMADYRPIPRVSLYGGLMVSNVYGGVASGFLHTENVAPTVGLRVRF